MVSKAGKGKKERGSSSKSSPKPSKGVKVFRDYVYKDSDAEKIVGKGIQVFWPLDNAWYDGVVKSFDSKKKKHSIAYDDGDHEVLDLHKEKVRVSVDEEEEEKKSKEAKRKDDDDEEKEGKEKGVEEEDAKKSKKAKKETGKGVSHEKAGDEGNDEPQTKNGSIDQEKQEEDIGKENPEKVKKVKQGGKRSGKKDSGSKLEGDDISTGLKENEKVETTGDRPEEQEEKVQASKESDVSPNALTEEVTDNKKGKKSKSRAKRGAEDPIKKHKCEPEQDSDRADNASHEDEGTEKTRKGKAGAKFSKRKADGNALSVEGKHGKQMKHAQKTEEIVANDDVSEQTTDQKAKRQDTPDESAHGTRPDEQQMETKESPFKGRKKSKKQQGDEQAEEPNSEAGAKGSNEKAEDRGADAGEVNETVAENKSSEKMDVPAGKKHVSKKQSASRKNK
eukprot:TRINITY_DN37652_c0_g1_i1.p1 TRINITY_DN37652_c0_g1~~TRINITY_DN37652_c0_g1_i1.p1  ORF type:complete len:448 (+),score=157.67 TRINITY_DN37652_c0_g1_i1:346-1689(+)